MGMTLGLALLVVTVGGYSSNAQGSAGPTLVSHDFTTSAQGWRISGDVGYNTMEQDDPLLPYTLNTALRGIDHETGATFDPAQLSYRNGEAPGGISGFAPHRVTTHTDSPSLSKKVS